MGCNCGKDNKQSNTDLLYNDSERINELSKNWFDNEF